MLRNLQLSTGLECVTICIPFLDGWRESPILHRIQPIGGDGKYKKAEAKRDLYDQVSTKKDSFPEDYGRMSSQLCGILQASHHAGRNTSHKIQPIQTLKLSFWKGVLPISINLLFNHSSFNSFLISEIQLIHL